MIKSLLRKYSEVPGRLCMLFLFMILFFSACERSDYINGNRKSASEFRQLASFDALNIQGSYEIVLKKGDEEGIEIIADENLIPHIVTEVEGTTLKIYNKEKIKNKDKLKVNISFREISEIISGGASSIKGDSPLQAKNLVLKMNGTGLMELELEAETLKLDLSGTGMINIAGNVEKEDLNLSGAGNLDASRLKSKDCNISLSGIGSAKIHVENHLKAKLSGVGGIKYRGNPVKVDREVAGIGTIDEEKE